MQSNMAVRDLFVVQLGRSANRIQPMPFPTNYYNAGGHFDSARYLDGWYGIAYHPYLFNGMPKAFEYAREDAKAIPNARIIHERTSKDEQVRLWIPLR
jgi:hypothetical protein